jgi:hypothetical protein
LREIAAAEETLSLDSLTPLFMPVPLAKLGGRGVDFASIIFANVAQPVLPLLPNFAEGILVLAETSLKLHSFGLGPEFRHGWQRRLDDQKQEYDGWL